MKQPLPPIKQAGSTLFENFDNLFRSVIAVPRATVDKQDAKWKRKQDKKRTKKKA